MTLTHEMVEIERAAFEAYALRAGLDTLRYQGVDEYHWLSTITAWKSWLARAQSQRAVGIEEFNEGDRVVWTNNYGNPFPATIYAKGIGYHLHLDDGTEITTTGKLRALIDRAGGGP